MRNFISYSCSLSLLLLLAAGQVSGADEARLSPQFSAALVSPIVPDSEYAVVIFFENSRQTQALASLPARQFTTRDQLIRHHLVSLPQTAAISSGILSRIAQLSSDSIVRFWITPAVTARLSLSEIAELSDDASIRMIVPNAELELIAPVKTSAASGAAAVSSELQLLKVPELWKKGFTGKGRLVCSFDTGVESSHPALASRWRGSSAPLAASWFSSIRPDTLPFDRIGHGSHTMGIMVGSIGADSFGVAPGAEWISAGVIDQGRPLGTTIGDILAAFQWALNPDGDTSTTADVPDVILNSWGIPAGIFGACDPTFWSAIDNLEAAGVVTIFAAGNEGPNPQSLRNPADRPTSPTNSMAIGAIDNNLLIASFSSRGPSRCDSTVIKPELVAPGVQIRSCTKGGGYAVMSGTSMAAPYVAGLVALCRDINPDATVEQIKTALLLSAVDLGQAGEDNLYGRGMVDASRLPLLLASTSEYAFELNSVSLEGDGIVWPGRSTAIRTTLTNLPGNLANVIGTISSTNGELLIEQATSGFIFGTGGTIATSAVPFRVQASGETAHGTTVPMALVLQTPEGTLLDTLLFDLTIGLPARGTIASLSTGALTLALSDFGAFGFAPGSAYNLEGAGLTFGQSGNLLYECGLVVGRSRLQLASSVRGADGFYQAGDFTPVVPISDELQDQQGRIHRTAAFTDQYAQIPIPIRVQQEALVSPEYGASGLVLVTYTITNSSLAPLTGLHAGLLLDIDLPDGEEVVHDAASKLTYFAAAGQPLVGLVALSGAGAVTVLANEADKRGLDDEQLFSLIGRQSDSLPVQSSADQFLVTSSPEWTLAPGGAIEFAYAIVAGSTPEELYQAAAKAREIFDVATSLDDQPGTLPDGFDLGQNYPNPFNPETIIPFALASSQQVHLEVFNLLGQSVAILVDEKLPAGDHQVIWNGSSSSGATAATGLYFYRLTTESGVKSRKMVLVR